MRLRALATLSPLRREREESRRGALCWEHAAERSCNQRRGAAGSVVGCGAACWPLRRGGVAAAGFAGAAAAGGGSGATGGAVAATTRFLQSVSHTS
jgi:hypothetical protein